MIPIWIDVRALESTGDYKDHIYLKENRYKNTKEMFKFIDKEAFQNKIKYK